MPEVVLLRHGETEWSATGRHTGTTDVPLTEAGRAEARAVGALLAGRPFARVLVSPLERAAVTCELAGLGPAEVVGDLCEWDYGELEGRTTEEIREGLPGWTVWTGPVPGGEVVEDVGHRVDRVIATVREVDGDVAIVAHGHLLRVLAARWLGLPPDAGRLLALSTATVSVVGWEREQPVVRRWNVPAPG
jgi:broad specificity phosphatase PhoE